MKRRDAIKISLIANASSSGVGLVTVFGTPASLAQGLQSRKNDPLVLPIEDVGIPISVRAVTRKISSLVSSISHDESVATAFVKNPENLLVEYGLVGILSATDPLIERLTLLVNPATKRLMRNRQLSPARLLTDLTRIGVINRVSKSSLRRFYVRALKFDQLNYERVLANPSRSTAAAQGPVSVPTDERVQFIISLLRDSQNLSSTSTAAARTLGLEGDDDEPPPPPPPPDPGPDPDPGPEGLVTVVTAVWIVAVAYTYAAVVATAVVAVSVVTQLAIWGSEQSSSGSLRVATDADPLLLSNATLDAHSQLVRNMNRVAALAALHGRRDLAMAGLVDSVNLDVESIVAAAEQLKLLKIPPRNKRMVIAQLQQLTLDSLGISRSARS